jgi:hypothetical protein
MAAPPLARQPSVNPDELKKLLDQARAALDRPVTDVATYESINVWLVDADRRLQIMYPLTLPPHRTPHY